VNITASTSANSIQTVGGVALCTGGACAGGVAMSIAGSTVATSSGYWTGPIATPVSGAASILFIGSGGNFYGRTIAANSGSLVCTGVADGWMAYYSFDSALAVCYGNSRFRTTLSAF
jgi:hypothetical protein